MFATTTIPQQIINNHHLRTGRDDTDENISPIENPIFVILTKIHLYKHYVQIAMRQRVFEHALFSRLRVQMCKDLKIGQRPWTKALELAAVCIVTLYLEPI